MFRDKHTHTVRERERADDTRPVPARLKAPRVTGYRSRVSPTCLPRQQVGYIPVCTYVHMYEFR